MSGGAATTPRRPPSWRRAAGLARRETRASGDGRCGSSEHADAVRAEREPNFLVARRERALLRAIAGRLPRWILPNDLTALGILAALGICAAYQLSNGGPAWLWVASMLLVLHWLGDSLDGTLARVRCIQRPRYGYYLDHLVDAVSTAAIGIGLGLSPYMLLSVGTLMVVAYLVLSINVYLESSALGRFSIGYGRVGPTEVRAHADRAQHGLGARPRAPLLGARERARRPRPRRPRPRRRHARDAPRQRILQPARARPRRAGLRAPGAMTPRVSGITLIGLSPPQPVRRSLQKPS